MKFYLKALESIDLRAFLFQKNTNPPKLLQFRLKIYHPKNWILNPRNAITSPATM
jgi:hypothetical protein